MLNAISHNKPACLILALVVVIAVSVGAISLTRASTPASSLEAEYGSVSGTVSAINDKSASDVKAVKFGGGYPQVFHTCYPYAFCDESGQHHILNGINVRFVGQYSSQTTLEQMQKIKDKGFDSVRLTMYWDVFQPSSGTSGFSATAFGKLQTAINNAAAAGLYVILDPIHGVGYGADCTNNHEHVPLWAYPYDDDGNCLGRIGAIQLNSKDYLQHLANLYGDNPTVIAVDLANEVMPLDWSDDNAVLDMYNTLIGYVRPLDNNKILMIEPTSGDKLFSAADVANDITDKSNIVYSTHFYFGGSYNADGTMISGCTATGYKSTGTACGNFTYENQAGYLYPDKANLDAHVTAELNMLSDSSVHLPDYVGEFNSAAGLPNSVQWRKDAVSVFKSHNLGWAVYDFYDRGSDEYQGPPPDSNFSATNWGADSGASPGDWKPWVDDLF